MRMRFVAVAGLIAAVGASLALTAGAGAGSAKTSKLVAQLKGRGEVPAAPASNRGRAEIKLNPATGKVCWEIRVTRIDGKANAAHIHQGGRGKAGPVVVPLGGAFTRKGCTTAKKSLVRAILARPRSFYVNVHNVKHPAGAMRGQLLHG